MKARLLSLARVLAVVFGQSLLAAAPTPPKAAPPAPLSPRFVQVRERINALFQHRNQVPSPPDPAGNPFRAPGVPITVSAPGQPDRPSNDLALLQQAVATLKVSGTMEISGQTHLIINARPYKKGDVVQSRADGVSVYLRVREITRRSVTFELNDTEMTLKF